MQYLPVQPRQREGQAKLMPNKKLPTMEESGQAQINQSFGKDISPRGCVTTLSEKDWDLVWLSIPHLLTELREELPIYAYPACPAVLEMSLLVQYSFSASQTWGRSGGGGECRMEFGWLGPHFPAPEPETTNTVESSSEPSLSACLSPNVKKIFSVTRQYTKEK